MLRRLRPLFSILFIVATTWLIWLVIALFWQETIVFPGMSREAPSEKPFDPIVEQWWLDVDGARVEAWYAPGLGQRPDNPGPLMMFFHGNGDIVDDRWNFVGPYRGRGIATLVMEYRGYGRATGVASETGIVNDAEAFLKRALERPEIDSKRLIFHGTSVGGGVAVALAARHKPNVLILESTFISMEEMFDRYFVPRSMCRHPFRNDLILPTLGVPVFIAHGTRDRLIPFEHARVLHQLTPGSILVEADCGHNEFETDWPGIFKFLESHGLKVW